MVIPATGADQVVTDAGPAEIKGLIAGTPIRVIRHPYFGRLGTVTGLPSPLQKLESESMARILEVEFASGEKAIIPRANVEMIED